MNSAVSHWDLPILTNTPSGDNFPTRHPVTSPRTTISRGHRSRGEVPRLVPPYRLARMFCTRRDVNGEWVGRRPNRATAGEAPLDVSRSATMSTTPRHAHTRRISTRRDSLAHLLCPVLFCLWLSTAPHDQELHVPVLAGFLPHAYRFHLLAMTGVWSL